MLLDYLLPYLRLKVGDLDPTKYRYLDAWLLTSLQLALKISYRYLGDRYLINDLNEVSRNPNFLFFDFPEEEEGVIQRKDEPILIVLAAILVLEGSLENSAWGVGSWKDYEISVSNIEGGKIRLSNVERLRKELESLVTPPTKRLALTKKGSLPGYTNNTSERDTSEV